MLYVKALHIMEVKILNGLTKDAISSASCCPVELESTETDCLIASAPLIKDLDSLIFRLIFPEEFS